jgi:hypothetical protein
VTLNPQDFTETNVWLYETEFVEIAPSMKSDSEFIITTKKAGHRISVNFRTFHPPRTPHSCGLAHGLAAKFQTSPCTAYLRGSSWDVRAWPSATAGCLTWKRTIGLLLLLLGNRLRSSVLVGRCTGRLEEDYANDFLVHLPSRPADVNAGAQQEVLRQRRQGA